MSRLLLLACTVLGSRGSTLPALDGTAYPPFSMVFHPGECTRPDGRGRIDVNKTCFSCFRIPTLLAGQTPGVIHAFAEGRRAGLETSEANVYHCPDGPDTRLVYKRSADYGVSWSSGLVFLQDPALRAENGLCQSQAAPVIDPVTKTLIVGFIANGAGCAPDIKPALVKSMDDGLTWSKPYELMLNMGKGMPPVPVQARSHFAIGPTKGLTVKLPSGGVRLMLPGEASWSSTVFSDDSGASWQVTAVVGRGSDRCGHRAMR